MTGQKSLKSDDIQINAVDNKKYIKGRRHGIFFKKKKESVLSSCKQCKHRPPALLLAERKALPFYRILMSRPGIKPGTFVHIPPNSVADSWACLTSYWLRRCGSFFMLEFRRET